MINAEEIRKKYGDYLFYRASAIPEWYINRTCIEIDSLKIKKVKFDIDIFYSGNYKVQIKMTAAGKILASQCDCDDYKKAKICPHILACLIKKQNDFFTPEEISLQKSQNILESFVGQEQQTSLREELGLEIEIEYSQGNFILCLKVGNGTKYVIKTKDKFNVFRTCYLGDGELVLGKKLTYSSDKYYFKEEDTKILEYLFNYSRVVINNYDVLDEPLRLNNREFSELLRLLEVKNFTLEGTTIKKIDKGLPTDYELEFINEEYHFFVKNYNQYTVVDNDARYIIYNNKLYLLNLQDSKIISKFIDGDISEIIFTPENLDLFKKGLLKKTINNIIVSDNVREIKIIKEKKISLYFDLQGDSVVARIKLKYGNEEFDYFDSVDNLIRDNDFENKVVLDLVAYGFVINKKSFEIMDADSTYNFLDNGLEYFTNNYTIFTTQKIKKLNIYKNVKVKSNFSIGKDNILTYDFNIENVNQDEINSLLRAIKGKKKYYRLKSGDVLSLLQSRELDDFERLTEDLNIDGNTLKQKKIIIPKYRAFFIDSLRSNRYQEIKTNNTFDEFINNFKTYKNIDLEFSEDENELLRGYQKDGVKWLYTLYKCDLGGILADEMGLGKTLQAIIFLRKVIELKKNAKILIVSPTSLVYNWENEFAKFAPELKYIVMADNKKKRQDIMQKFAEYNIFITTYGLVRNDNDYYEDKDFEVCIIDEAQAIKNYQTGMTREIKKIKARTKIAMTGTPLENSVLELWSLFDFIMPGYLNSITRFKDAYGIKDVDSDSLKKLDTLNYQIKPFILRRKKNEVSQELPDKIEQIEYLDMSEPEKSLYQSLVLETKRKINEAVTTEGFGKARFKIVTLLTRLRQLCVSPKLLDSDYNGESVKIKRLLGIVKELIKENHKILIFSSFKSAVYLVKEALDRENISNYVIDGSIKGQERVRLVEAFNKDKTSCFLITLKSGGTGLNLTSADVVIHLDVWWNPQVENQATDRAHRIGQTKKVTVLKLINKGTIEEKIIELQEKKKVLSDNLIEGKDIVTLNSLSEEELVNLLRISYESDKENEK